MPFLSDLVIRRPTTSVRVRALDRGRIVERPDRLVTEEPMEIRVHGPAQHPMPLAVTMRTPGDDFELAVGFCVTEGVVSSPDSVASVSYCVEGGEQRYNIVTVRLREPVSLDGRERSFTVNASCGLCGKAALDQVEVACTRLDDDVCIAGSTVLQLPERLRDAQQVFDVTGGLHAAALFDPSGDLVTLREDVGRHNALDKLVGHAALHQRLPLGGHVLLVSGRVSCEIVQKAVVACIPTLCAVSAPSSLAVQAADRLGQTVVGFVRPERFNVYSHPERVDVDR